MAETLSPASWSEDFETLYNTVDSLVRTSRPRLDAWYETHPQCSEWYNQAGKLIIAGVRHDDGLIRRKNPDGTLSSYQVIAYANMQIDTPEASNVTYHNLLLTGQVLTWTTDIEDAETRTYSSRPRMLENAEITRLTARLA